MKYYSLLAIVCMLTVGCDSSTQPASENGAAAQGSDSAPQTPEMYGQGSGTSEETSASASGSAVDITPENTMIQFVGVHTDEAKPDPRTCKFNAFSGKLMHEDGKVTGIEVEIETESLSSEIDKLTDHLKGPDFFGVKENPTATFKTTSVEAGEEGAVTVTGDLTLLGTTKSISFPATVSMEGGKMTFNAEFEIDRTEFGMDYGVDKIEKAVAMTIAIEA